MVLIELSSERQSSGEVEKPRDIQVPVAPEPTSNLLEDDVDRYLAGEPEPEADKETVDDLLQADKLPQDTTLRSTPRRDDLRDRVTESTPDVDMAADEASPLAGATRGDWLSDESRQLRRWGLIGGTGVAVVIVVIVLIGVAISRRSKDSSITRGLSEGPSETETSATSGDEQHRDAEGERLRDGASERRASSEPVVDSREAGEESDSRVSEGGTSGGTATREGLHGNGTRPVETRNDTQEPDRNRSGELAHAAGADSGPGVQDRQDALPFEPEAIDLFEPIEPADAPNLGDSSTSGLSPQGERSTPGSGPPPFREEPGRRTFRLPPGLRDVEDLLLDRPADPTLILADSPYDLIPVPGIPYDLGAAMPKPSPSVVNVTSQLNVRIPEARFTDIPLRELVQFVADFSTISITIDIDAIERLGLSADKPISLHATDTELGRILQMGLESLGLEHITVDSQLIVTEKDRERLEERGYEVRDLTGDDPAGSAALQATITGLIYPATWEARGGAGTIAVSDGRLTVTQTPEVHFQVELFCEHLRLARGLKLLGKLPPHRSNLDLRISSVLPKLEQPYQADFAVPAKLTAILEQIASDVGMIFVVDWHSLKGAGWNPDALARLELQDEPLGTVLRELLGPMQLSFRIIDGRTLQVTTEEVAFKTLEIGFFPLEDLRGEDAGQKVLEAVRGAITDMPALERVGGGMRYDAPSQTLAVSAAQYQLAAVARQMEQLRLQTE